MIIYKNLVDVHTWMSKKATVLIISYDMFTALSKKSLAAELKTAGSEPTGKVMLLCCTWAAWYNTGLLSTLTTGVVFYFLFFSPLLSVCMTAAVQVHVLVLCFC